MATNNLLVAPKTTGGVSLWQTTTSAPPRVEAVNAMNADNAKLQALNNVAGGSRYRRRRHGGSIVLPQGPPIIAKDPSVGTAFSQTNQTTNSQILQLKQQADGALDSKVVLAEPLKTGGKRTKRRGGFIWPCLSGGKKQLRKTKKTRKSLKTRKSRKTRRK
jgi:hypothetical protein